MELKNRPANEFRGGCIGYNVCPKIPYLSTIPKIADFEAAEKKYKDRNTRLNKEEKEIIDRDRAEKAIIDGFQDYFQKKHHDEDVFLLFRQYIPGIDYVAKKYERDAVMINLTRGYILNMEAKSTLRDFKGLQQLQRTLEILNNYFNGNLEKEWTIITLLYGSKIHEYFPCCDICKPYVLKEEDDFQEKLQNILRNEDTKDASYTQDFYFLVKELLPAEVKIADTLTNTFNMNTALLSVSSRNIKEGGKAENVAFWSPSQANIALKCLDLLRVLFKSGWSTGKTILMMDCAKKLLDIGQPVLFVINDHYRTSTLVKNKRRFNKLPLLLQMKLEEYFKDYGQLIKIVSVEQLEFEQLPEFVEEYKGYNIFIDEMRFDRSVDGHDEKVYCNLKKVHNAVQYKHFWIAITVYEGKDVVFDTAKLRFFYHFPLELSLRNSYQITKKVLENENKEPYNLHDSINGISEEANQKDYLKDEKQRKLYRAGFPVSNPDDVDLEKKESENSNTNKNLVGTQPSNQTHSFDVKPAINASDYKHGIHEAISELRKISENVKALFIIDSQIRSGTSPMLCIAGEKPGCLARGNYNGALKSLLLETFKDNGRDQPVIYIDEDGIEDARQWVASNIKSRDLICEYALIQGFEHDAVVVFQDQNPEKFEHNSCMRAKSILIIVELPKHQKRFCFGKCRLA